jgi:hypothetical protein
MSTTAARRPTTESPRDPSPRERRVSVLAKVGIVLAGLLALLFLVGLVPNETLRRSIESRMNESLQGYEVRIGKARLRPLGLSVTLDELVVRQTAHPEPPILAVRRLHSSVHWKELLFLRVVADFAIDHPAAYINLPQLRSELVDEVPVERKGWQEAVQAIYPLKINLLNVRDGALTYVDGDPKKPLEMTRIDLRAGNIRNIHSKERTYPSPVEASAVIAGSGKVEFRGHADFMAEPHAGVKGDFRVATVPLDSFGELARNWNVLISGGTFSAAGQVELAPRVRDISIPEITIDGIQLGYLKRAGGAPESGLAPAAKKAADEAQAAKKETGQAEDVPWNMRLDRFRLTRSTLELVDRSRDPDYRLFLTDVHAEVDGLSNRDGAGDARATARGKFMGRGDLQVDATFRPKKSRGGMDFDVKLEIAPTPMTALNDLFRAYGKFDVFSGTLQVFSELGVHDDYMRGYVKPIFKDIEIYDSRQEKDKSVFKKVYESVVDAASTILTNQKKDQVATNAPIEGPIGKAGTNIFEVLGGLLENAFVRAILPGFDQQVGTRKAD